MTTARSHVVVAFLQSDAPLPPGLADHLAALPYDQLRRISHQLLARPELTDAHIDQIARTEAAHSGSAADTVRLMRALNAGVPIQDALTQTAPPGNIVALRTALERVRSDNTVPEHIQANILASGSLLVLTCAAASNAMGTDPAWVARVLLAADAQTQADPQVSFKHGPREEWWLPLNAAPDLLRSSARAFGHPKYLLCALRASWHPGVPTPDRELHGSYAFDRLLLPAALGQFGALVRYQDLRSDVEAWAATWTTATRAHVRATIAGLPPQRAAVQARLDRLVELTNVTPDRPAPDSLEATAAHAQQENPAELAARFAPLADTAPGWAAIIAVLEQLPGDARVGDILDVVATITA